MQFRVDRDLDEMENMVHGALTLLRGLNDDESAEAVDINELLGTLQGEFAEMGTPLRSAWAGGACCTPANRWRSSAVSPTS